MSLKYCIICNSIMNSGLQKWHWQCKKCKYENSDLKPSINHSVAYEKIDEKSRKIGLQSLRIENFNKLLGAIKNLRKEPGSLLDVGCAHGWFLVEAKRIGFKVLGIEPDLKVLKMTSVKGLKIRQGFFPEVLYPNEKFDVIVFNDVFEHIININDTLAGCRRHLDLRGLLVLNLPNSSGIFYKLACLLSMLGFNGFFERLWQKDLPSPHLHYFCKENLKKLLQLNGFELVKAGFLPSVKLKGLYKRISHVGNFTWTTFFIYFLILIFFPLLFIMPSDSIYVISRKIK
jgi:2-polyprenyl-3-methyl-5-hydroxy-6-metoxy-1,4-benzoquinol methylase